MFPQVRCLALIILLCTVLPLGAQTRALGDIAGAVTDRTGAALSGAEVTAKNDALGLKFSTRTDDQGRFHFAGLPLTGMYAVTLSKAGFAPAQAGPLQLRAGATSTLQITMQVAGQIATIEVSGTADTINASNAQLQTRLDLPKIFETPVLSRRLSTLALLDSNVHPARGTGDLFLNSTLFVIAGGGRRQTTYAVDNGTGNDSWGRQALFTTFPFDVVQEFTILPDALSAEYGLTTGSAINIVTKSGTNQWHGDVGAMWRPSSLGANMPLAVGPAGDTFTQGTGTISGPIVRDRTFFLLSDEYNAEKRDSVITSPLDPGAYTGEFHQDLFFARLDQHWSDRHASFLRLNLDHFTDTNPADAVGGLTLPSAARTFTRGTYDALLSDTISLTSNLLSEARLQMQVGSPITEFDPVNPSTQYVRPGLGTEGESRSARLMNHQYEAADTLSWMHGAHTVRFGVDAIYSSSGGFGQEFGGGYVLGQFTLKPLDTTPVSALTINDIQRYTQSFGNQNYQVDDALIGAFVQDDFRWTPRLTLNLGLRYEKQTFTDSTLGFQPRIGFAYRLPVAGTTVLRGSYGIFDSEIRANLAAGYKINGPEGAFTFSARPGDYGFPTGLQPLTGFPEGAVLPARDITVRVGQRAYLSQFFDVSKLRFYPDALLNPYTQQWTLSLEHELSPTLLLSVDYLGQRSVRLERPVDLNAPAPVADRPAGVTADQTRPIVPVPGGYRRIVATVNAGQASYNGLSLKLNKRFSSHFSGLLTYTWSHAINTVDPDIPQQDPADSNFFGSAETATSLLDQRHRVSASGWYQFPLGITFGSWISAASGRPFNVTTGIDNNGDGSFSDRPVIDGVMVPRNWGQGTPTYDISAFVEKNFRLRERANLTLRAEGYNLTNTINIVGRNGVYCVRSSTNPSCTFGQALGGMSNVEPGRQFQMQVRLSF